MILRSPWLIVLGGFNIHSEAQDFMVSMTAMGLSQIITFAVTGSLSSCVGYLSAYSARECGQDLLEI